MRDMSRLARAWLRVACAFCSDDSEVAWSYVSCFSRVRFCSALSSTDWSYASCARYVSGSIRKSNWPCFTYEPSVKPISLSAPCTRATSVTVADGATVPVRSIRGCTSREMGCVTVTWGRAAVACASVADAVLAESRPLHALSAASNGSANAMAFDAIRDRAATPLFSGFNLISTGARKRRALGRIDKPSPIGALRHFLGNALAHDRLVLGDFPSAAERDIELHDRERGLPLVLRERIVVVQQR